MPSGTGQLFQAVSFGSPSGPLKMLAMRSGQVDSGILAVPGGKPARPLDLSSARLDGVAR